MGKICKHVRLCFNGSWNCTLIGSRLDRHPCSDLFSILVYGIVLLSARLGATAMAWMPLTTALIVGFLATLIKHWVPDLTLVLVILSSVAIILPGYSISLGAGELVAQKVLSGMANLMSGLITLFKQIAGSVLGVGFASLLVGIQTQTLKHR